MSFAAGLLLERTTNAVTLPEHVRSTPAPVPLPAAAESTLALHGVHVCAKWSVLATETAFFSSVTRAITLTPFFSMGAIALFTRSLVISYAALYCLVGMVISLLGLMHAADIPLGVTAALALSLVIGISVDYLIHLAHAYRNSLFADRFYKSRAALFARAQSIASAAATTLVAVSPLLGAQLLILREFGQIFVIVTLVSLVFAIGFLVLLMAAGPRRTRGGQRADPPIPGVDGAPPEARVTHAHSEGESWSVQLNYGEAQGRHMPQGLGTKPGRGRPLASRDQEEEEEVDEML